MKQTPTKLTTVAMIIVFVLSLLPEALDGAAVGVAVGFAVGDGVGDAVRVEEGNEIIDEAVTVDTIKDDELAVAKRRLPVDDVEKAALSTEQRNRETHDV